MDLEKYVKTVPEIAEMVDLKESFWLNPGYTAFDEIDDLYFSWEDMIEARDRLKRFAPYLAKVFPGTAPTGGIIESELREINNMHEELEKLEGKKLSGRLLLKMDSHLPVSGSIKARGGAHAVLKRAEDLAIEAGLLKKTDDYSIIDGKEFRDLFSKYEMSVASTGNLGLSIGIFSAGLGFRVSVHMSQNAKQWKKDLLRAKGCRVVEYPCDFDGVIAQSRAEAGKDPRIHFVDDEKAVDLFKGYTVGAIRTADQLSKMGITVDDKHPLFIYLPSGIGGAPGGIGYGFKRIFGDNVRFYFVEPTGAPCCFAGFATGLFGEVCVQDFGIALKSCADGLAVPRASTFFCEKIRKLISGCSTVCDDRLYRHVALLSETEGVGVEPSAAAGFKAYMDVVSTDKGMKETSGLNMENATHIVWATGGSMMPEDEMRENIEKGKALLSKKD